MRSLSANITIDNVAAIQLNGSGAGTSSPIYSPERVRICVWAASQQQKLFQALANMLPVCDYSPSQAELLEKHQPPYYLNTLPSPLRLQTASSIRYSRWCSSAREQPEPPSHESRNVRSMQSSLHYVFAEGANAALRVV